VASHRLLYTVGITNGLPPTDPAAGTVDGNSRKDYYARVDYKFGGMGLDGDTTGQKLPPENWRESSFRVGVFGYSGDGRGIDFVVTDPSGPTDFNQQDRRYDRAGGYLSWYCKDLNVFGVVMHGSDKLQNFDQTTGALFNESTRSFDAWFAQADYVIRPPFQVSFRYENLNPADSTADNIRFYNADFSFLSRANIKTMLEYRRDAHESENYTLAGVLRFAY